MLPAASALIKRRLSLRNGGQVSPRASWRCCCPLNFETNIRMMVQCCSPYSSHVVVTGRCFPCCPIKERKKTSSRARPSMEILSSNNASCSVAQIMPPSCSLFVERALPLINDGSDGICSNWIITF